MKDVSKVLAPEELHIFNIVLKDVKIQVSCGKKTGETITNIGTPQGECTSAILFTINLATPILEKGTNIELEHNYARSHNKSEKFPFDHL